MAPKWKKMATMQAYPWTAIKNLMARRNIVLAKELIEGVAPGWLLWRCERDAAA